LTKIHLIEWEREHDDVTLPLKEGAHTHDVTDEDGNEFKLTYVLTKKDKEPLYRQREWLEAEYVEKKRTMQSIADEFGLTPMAIFKWLKKHGLATRPPGRFSSLELDS